MVSLEVIEKRGGAVGKIAESNEIFLSQASVVRIDLPRAQVRGMRRVGNDLVLTTTAGDTVTVHGFFTPFGDARSDLVLNDDGGGKWLADIGEGQGELAVGYTGIDAIEPLLLQQSVDLGALPWVVGGGLAAAAIASSGGSGDGPGVLAFPPMTPPVTPPPGAADTTPPAQPTVRPTNGASVSGLAEPGAVVTLTDGNGRVLGSATAGPDGSYTITPTTPPPDGSVVHVVATDPAGNASPPATVTVDSTPPAAPTVQLTDGSPITGTAEPGAVVTVTDGNGHLIGSTTAGANGTYTLTPNPPPPDGTVLHVSATDAAGNTGPVATVTVDSTPPAAPHLNPTDGSPITGTAEAGAVVTVSTAAGTVLGSVTAGPDGSFSFTPATPPAQGTVIVAVATDPTGNVSPPASATIDGTSPTPTVDPTDGSPITGTAEPGAVVTVSDGGTVIGSATVAPNGSYSITPTTVPPNGTVLSVVATDAGGHPSLPATVTVDSVAPAVPTVALTDGSPITGTAEPGAVVTVTDSAGTVIGSTTATPGGTYSIVPTTPPANGTLLHVTATDAAGNTSAPASVTVDSVAPDAPTVNPTDGSPITGTAEAGALVTVTDGAGTVIGSTTATPGGTYSIVPATTPANGTVLHVTATDPTGNTSAQATATVDSAAPVIAVAIATDANNDGFINAAEKGPDVTVKVSLVSGAAVGDVIDVTDGTTTTSVTLGAADLANGYVNVVFANPAEGATLNVSATSRDLAGNVSAPATDSATLDTTLATPGLVVGSITPDNVVNAAEAGTQVTVSGTATGTQPGNVVTLVVNGVSYSGTVDAGGNWHIAVAGSDLVADADHAVAASVVATDAAGNTATGTATQPYGVSTVAPLVTIGAPVAGDDRVNAVEDHAVIVSGTTVNVENGQTVTVTFSDGTHSVTTTATVAGNAWTATAADISGLTNGPVTVRADVQDIALNPASDTHTVTLDTIAPTQAAVVVTYTDNAGTDQGNFAGGGTTDDTTPTLNGTLSAALGAGDVVNIYDGATLVGTATVSGTAWSFTPPALADGSTHTYTAVVADAAGNQGTPSAGFTLTVDTSAPTQTAAIAGGVDDVGSVQGSLASGGTTDDTTPTLNGTLSAALGAGDVVRIYDGAVFIGTATVTGTTWTFTQPALPPLPDGSTHSYTAVVADAAGNQGAPSAAFALTIDTTPPVQTAAIATITDNAGTVQGSFGSGTSTDDTTPVLNGTLSAALGAGDTVRIYDGATLVGTASVSGTGWSFAVAPLPDGSAHSYTAVVADAAGNEGPASAPFTLTVDTTAPTQTAGIASCTDNAGGNQGSFASGSTTDDTTPVLNGTLSAALGAGDTVRIYEGATLIGTATVSGTAWSYATPTLADGSTHTYTALVADAAGNEGPASAGFTLTVDTTPPAQAVSIASYADDTGLLVGNFASGTLTDDTTPVLNGTLSAAIGATDSVRIYEGTTLLGTATVSGTSWTFATPMLADGSIHTYTAVVVDAAGNAGTASGGFTLIVDTTPPVQTAAIASYTDNVGLNLGNFGGGTVTDDTAPVLNGTLSAALGATDTVRVYDGGTFVGTATVTGTSWTFAPTVLADGSTHVYTAVVADAAGNLGAASAGFTLTVDTTAPTTGAAIASFTDNVGSVQADLGSGTATDDTTPVLNGTLSAALDAGDTVRIYEGATLVGTATVSGTTWTFATPALADGTTHTYTAVVADAAGNQGPASAGFTLTIDTTPPVQTASLGSFTDNVGTDQANFGSGTFTDDTTPVLNGTLSGALGTGDTVRIYDGAVFIGTATVTGTTWTFATPALADGSTHSYTAVVADAAGNQGTVSAGFTLGVDTTPPVQTAAIGTVTDNVGTVQGSLVSGGTTDDTTPTLNGTLSAALGAGDTVRIYDGATLVGTATVSGTTWTFAAPPLTDGSTHTYTAVVADAAGNESTASAGFTLTVDTTPPVLTASLAGYTDNVGTDQGSFSAGGATDDTTPVLNGTLSAALGAGDTVRIYDGATWVGTATVTGTTWSFATPVLADGSTHTYTAVVADAAGNQATASAGLTLNIDTTAPTQTASLTGYTDNVGTDQAIFGSGTVTDDTTPVLNGTLSAALGAGDTVRIYDGATWVGTATVTGTTWSFAPLALPDGSTHTYTALVADAAGNEGTPSTGFTLTIDTTAPTATASFGGYTDNVGTDQGSFGSGTLTDDATPVLNGTLSAPLAAGEAVRIYDGATLVGTATVVGSTWAFAPGALADGSTHTYTAVVADAAGNQGAPSAGFVLTVDTTPPTQTASLTGYTDDVGTDQASFGSGTVTDDTTPTLDGTLSAALGAGDVVRIYDGAALVGTATVTGTTWHFTPTPLADGSTHTYTAVVADAAGNQSAPSAALTLTVDTTAPTLTVNIGGYTDNAGTDQGSFPAGTPTDDTTPVLTGTLSAALAAGDMVRIYEGATLIGTATVSGTTWSFATPVLLDGSSHTYTAVVADAAGNQGPASAGFTLTVDTTPPTLSATIVSYTDNAGLQVGDFLSGSTTDDTTPVLNGTLSAALGAGDVVRIYEGTTLLGTATVVGTGWTFATPGLFNNSVHTYTAVVADAAGNQGALSGGFTLSVSTTAPAQTAAIASYSDDVGANVGNFASGVPTDDTTPVLNGTLSAAIGGTDVVRIYDGAALLGTATVIGTGWTFALPQLPDGSTHSYTAVVTDAAGNEGTPSAGFALTVDATPPAQAIAIASYADNAGSNVGSFGSGTVTDDTTPVLNGTLSAPLGAGEVIRLYDGATWVGTATVSGTAWSFATPVLADGSSHTYTAVVVDAAGNQGTASPGFTLTVDTTPPVQSAAIVTFTDNVGTVQAQLASGSTTDDTTPVLNGTLSAALGAGDVVRIYEGATLIGTATVSGTTWSFATPALADGTTHTYTAVVADAAGNQGPVSGGFTLSVDTTAPTLQTAIVTATDNVGTVQVDLVSGAVTDDTTPVLNGTLSAALGAGDTVRIYEGAVLVGTATVSGTAWTFAPPALANGSTHTYTAVVADAAGNEGTASAGFTLGIDTTPPVQTAAIATVTDNVGTVQALLLSGSSTDDTTPVLNGSLSAAIGATDVVRIYDGAVFIGTATVSGTNWSFATPVLANGSTHVYTAVVADAAGNQSAASAGFTLTIDTTPPVQTVAIVTATDNVGSVQTDLASGSPTDDTTPVLNGTLSAALGAGDVVRIYEGATLVGTATVSGTGWSFATPLLANGSTHTYTAVVADAAGNEGAASAGFTLTIDTTPPVQTTAIATFTDNVGSVQAQLASGSTTDDTTPVLNGTLSAALGAGDTVRIYEGATLIGTATVSGTTWSFATPVLASGSTHTYTAVVADAAGNQATASAGFTLTIDTTPPVQTALIVDFTDNVGIVLGNLASGTVTDDTTPVLNGTLSAALGAGDVVRIYDGAVFIGTATVAGTAWTFATPVLLDGSTHVYTAAVADAAGNQATASAGFTLTVDTTPPAQAALIVSFADNVGLNLGNFGSGIPTDDTTPVLNGTLSAAIGATDTVRIYDGATFVGTATVTGTAWAFAPAALVNGSTHVYTAVVADAAGNQTAASAGFTLSVDTTAPTALIDIVSISDDTGSSLTDFLTKDTTLTVNGTVGTLGAGEKAQISIDGTTWVDLTVVGGAWSYVDARVLPGGSYTYQVRVVDAAGNLGPTDTQAVVVDVTAPTQLAGVASFIDNLGPLTGTLLNGAVTDDTTPVLNGSISAGVAAGDTLRIYQDGTLVQSIVLTAGQTSWSYAPAALGFGLHSYVATLVDAAGNESAAGVPFTLTVDALATLNTLANDTGVTLAGGFSNSISAVNTDLVTRDGTPVLAGTIGRALQADEVVRISLDGGLSWTTVQDTDGATGWTYAPPAYAATTTVAAQVRVENTANGTHGTASTVSFTVDLGAPLLALAAPGFANAGSIDTDGDRTIAAGTATFSSAVSGTAEVGTTVALINDVNHDGVYTEGLDVVLGTALVGAGGAWSLSAALNATVGAYHLGYVVWDAAGNQSRLSTTAQVDVVPVLDHLGAAAGVDGTSNTTGFGGAMAVNLLGNWSFVGDQAVYNGSSRSAYATTDLAQVLLSGGTSTAYAFFDYNLDGLLDVIGTDNNAGGGNSTPLWAGTALGYLAGVASTGLTGVSNGGVAVLDMDGDGFLDAVVGDGAGDSASFLKNTAGVFTPYGNGSGIGLTASGIASLQTGREVSGVDLNNDGRVDLALHSTTTTTLSNTNDFTLTLLTNNGQASINGANWTESQALNDVFATNAATGNATDAVSLTWADFNGDGYLDLYVNSSRAGTASKVYVNNAGTLSGTGIAVANDTLAGDASVALDWNGDGRMDAVELDYATGVANLYTNSGSVAAGAWTTRQLADLADGAVNSMAAADYDWDGDIDLLVGMNGSTATQLIANTNQVKDGTALHLRILNAEGFNVYYGNTVQVFDAGGTLVSTQILNAQSGSWSNDGSGIVNVFGLDPAQTYTVKLLANSFGTPTTYTWEVTPGLATDAQLLTTSGLTAALPNVMTGTGYDDTYVVDSVLGGSIVYNGGGGWSTPLLPGESKTWSATGGMDIVDFRNATSGVGVDLTTNLVTGWGILGTVNNVEGVRGSALADTFVGSLGDNLFEGRGGNDTYFLGGALGVNTGNDRLVYKLLNAADSATGGNGSDVANGFTLGSLANAASTDADLIDLGGPGGLLSGYGGTAHVYRDADSGGYVLDASSAGLLNYIHVTNVGGNTVIAVDLSGTGSFGAALLTLTGVTTSLETLLANGQLLVGGSGGGSGPALAFAQAEPLAAEKTASTVPGDTPHTLELATSGQPGHETLLYKLLSAASATGGNAFDDVHGFTVGDFASNADADRIDLSGLLTDYAAHTGDPIGSYLQLTSSNGNTVLSIDRDGAGSAQAMTPLLSLHGVSTDLATLLANHQLVVV